MKHNHKMENNKTKMVSLTFSWMFACQKLWAWDRSVLSLLEILKKKEKEDGEEEEEEKGRWPILRC